MNVLKNFEALFVVTVALACGATYALDKSAAPAQDNNMQVVVSAKRMTPEQKLQSVLEERANTLAAEAKKTSAI
ncbi:hypothetical protein SAMN05216319_0641 [Duganella sp. CF402]|uniref:hypothetical protein n=1 Tax=unclassified Duganella TaxID=2636909 RepID=UPI0008D16673|nr:MULTISPECIES: hypothetical protein [unclassified Duganella]RZT10893.1 hypothetical protein EV582_2985 [Duganella sp. BK701]SEK91501.1 hypothetical protein SAMN05216319_0641 [Duganella sp. CF402]